MSIPHYIASTRIGQGFLVLCGLLMASCSQDQLPAANEKADEISFQTTTSLTRGLIGSLTSGSEICLYGYKYGNPLANDNENKRLEGKTLRSSGDSWAVYNGDTRLTYFWEGDGNYKFFGWLTKDGTGNLTIPFTTNYDNNTKTLTIPETTLDENYNQLDFLYSNVVNREVSGNQGKEAVPLNMNHLFSAFSIGIQNTSEDDITVNSIKLQRLHTTGTATIDFSSATKVTYNTYNTSSTEQPLAENNTGYTLKGTNNGAGGTRKPNIFNSADVDQKFYMVWPQAKDVIYSSELKNKTDDVVSTMGDEHFPLIMDYTVNGESVHKKMKFPEMAWEPGKKYSFDVLIADKIVQMNVTVLDWDYTTSDVDFKESVSIKENGHLQYDDTNNKCTIDKVNKIVYVENGQPVEATFCLDTPQGGQWEVSLEGDVNEFHIIDDAAPTNDGIGPIDGKTHRIKIVPNIASPTRDYKVRLKFIAKSADGQKTFNADDVIQDDPTDGDEHDTDIYTIVLRKA